MYCKCDRQSWYLSQWPNVPGVPPEDDVVQTKIYISIYVDILESDDYKLLRKDIFDKRLSKSIPEFSGRWIGSEKKTSSLEGLHVDTLPGS